MIKFIAFILCCLFSITLLSQSKDETAVSNAVNVLRQAMLDGNKIALEKITSEDLSYGHSSGKIENKKEFVEALASGKSDFVTLNLSEQSITITGNTAIVRHKLQGETNDNGKSNTVNLLVMQVWIKQKIDWYLLARQAVKLQ